MPIKLLTPETIGKIAAGEVVERPSSVVKELIENALDAGARRISVEVRGGGIESIEISDDGIGISPDDLAMALERHATSKLRSFDDLDTLATLGFRGEALASISAVSSFAIRSRTEDRPAGTSIRVEFGDRYEPVTVAAPGGTTVSVRDLFGNVPARRKFLRQPSTEHGYVGRVVAAYSCAYPQVQFSLTLDGRNVISTNGSGDYLAAASGVFGVEVGKAALLVEPLEESAAVPGVTVDGWIGAPTVSRSHRQDMIFFVNGRWVQHRAMSFALEEAYHSLLMVGRHPIAFLHVHVDPATIDVNVHPTKAEIKFQDERAACRAVQRSAHAALARAPHDELPGASFTPVFSPVSQPSFSMPLPAGRIQAIEPENEVSVPAQSNAHQSAAISRSPPRRAAARGIRRLRKVAGRFGLDRVRDRAVWRDDCRRSLGPCAGNGRGRAGAVAPDFTGAGRRWGRGVVVRLGSDQRRLPHGNPRRADAFPRRNA